MIKIKIYGGQSSFGSSYCAGIQIRKLAVGECNPLSTTRTIDSIRRVIRIARRSMSKTALSEFG